MNAPTYGKFKTWDKLAWQDQTSKIDYMIVNKAAKALLCKAWLDRNQYFPGHLMVCVQLDLTVADQMANRVKAPGRLGRDYCDEARTDQANEWSHQLIVDQAPRLMSKREY